MFFKAWKLMVSTVNMSDGEADTVERFEDEKVARQKFFDKCSQYGGNPQVKKVQVTLFNPLGTIERMEQIDNSKYEVETK